MEYQGTNVFELIDGSVILLGFCEDPDYNNFMNDHYSIFYVDHQNAKNLFLYTITNNGQFNTLTITNGNQDVAVYGDVELYVSDVVIDNLVISPNPVEDILFINSKEALKSILVYDIAGNLIMNSNGINSKDIKLDMSYNKSGIYLLMGETYQNEKIIKKIIKL